MIVEFLHLTDSIPENTDTEFLNFCEDKNMAPKFNGFFILVFDWFWGLGYH